MHLLPRAQLTDEQVEDLRDVVSEEKGVFLGQLRREAEPARALYAGLMR